MLSLVCDASLCAAVLWESAVTLFLSAACWPGYYLVIHHCSGTAACIMQYVRALLHHLLHQGREIDKNEKLLLFVTQQVSAGSKDALNYFQSQTDSRSSKVSSKDRKTQFTILCGSSGLCWCLPPHLPISSSVWVWSCLTWGQEKQPLIMIIIPQTVRMLPRATQLSPAEIFSLDERWAVTTTPPHLSWLRYIIQIPYWMKA